MKLFLKLFAAFTLFSCSKNESFETIQIADKTFSASDINIAIYDDSNEIVLDNGERLYTKKGAEIVASKVKGWRLPSEDDMESIFSHLEKNTDKFKDSKEVEKYFHGIFNINNSMAEKKGNEEPKININNNPNTKGGSFWLSDQEYKRDDVYNFAISLGQNIDKKTNKIRYKTSIGKIESDDYEQTYLSVRLIKDDSSISENINDLDGLWRTKKSFKGILWRY